MRRTLMLVAAVCVGSWACDEGGDDATLITTEDSLKDALPKGAAMALRMPHRNALVGEQATFYAFTRGVTVNLNSFVWAITHRVEDITDLPPTETDGETFAVWGPHTEPLSPATWRVRVDRVAEGNFNYLVEAWPKEAGPEDALVVLEGNHQEGAGPEQGVGSWTFDMSAAHSLDPIANEATGRVSVTYDVAEARSLEMHLDEVQGPHDPMTSTALYRYSEAADRSGSLDFIANLDIHADDNPALDRRELTRIRTRWTAAGAGRADVVASHGDLPAGTQVDAVECWSDAFLQTYTHFVWEQGEATEGDVADCVYDEAEHPTFEDFDPDSFADEGLVEAIPAPEELEPIELVADPADDLAAYYVLARNTIEGLLAPVRGVLGLVHQITRHPPTDCEPAQCTWGPYTNWETRVSFRLTVQTEGEGAHVYQLEAKRFGAPAEAWRMLIDGGVMDGAPGHDQGWFVYDFDAFFEIDPATEERGTFRVEYANAGDEHQLNFRGDQIQNTPDDTPSDIRAWIDAGPEGGLVDVGLPVDIDENGSERERLEGRMRWSAGGGIGNVEVTGGDLEGAEVLAAECWDARGARSHFDWLRQAEGGEGRPEIDPAACVFEDWQGPVFPPHADEAA